LELKTVDWGILVKAALEARNNAYAPYSHFAVGASLLADDGTVFTGCNVENASYGATNCAERTAFFKAVSEGRRKFTAIAIAGGKEGREPEDYVYPCGICRQVMSEFCDGDFVVLIAKNEKDFVKLRLGELLPESFTLN
jgi:cytidine deaminase